jgi:hypothetical protein
VVFCILYWWCANIKVQFSESCFYLLFLRLLQIRDFSLAEVSKTEFVNPTSVIFLQRLHLFLTFHGRSMSVWNYRGEPVTYFEDHVLWYPDCTRRVCITGNQDIVVSYCRPDPDHPSTHGKGNIHNFLAHPACAC